MPETPDQFDETLEEAEAQTRAIRVLNDSLRQTFVGSRVLITQGVQALSMQAQAKVIDAVRTFDVFTEDNDPYQTHDFGAFDSEDENLMWKVDCYDKSLQYGSPDPTDPGVTTRVLTIFLASEY